MFSPPHSCISFFFRLNILGMQEFSILPTCYNYFITYLPILVLTPNHSNAFYVRVSILIILYADNYFSQSINSYNIQHIFQEILKGYEIINQQSYFMIKIESQRMKTLKHHLNDVDSRTCNTNYYLARWISNNISHLYSHDTRF
jgi:hypothetical protein